MKRAARLGGAGVTLIAAAALHMLLGGGCPPQTPQQGAPGTAVAGALETWSPGSGAEPDGAPGDGRLWAYDGTAATLSDAGVTIELR